MVEGADGPRVFTLQGADQVYRSLIEGMNEGALLLDRDSVILYCNACFARLLQAPLERVIGTRFSDRVPDGFKDHFSQLAAQGWEGRSKGELPLRTTSGLLMPCSLSMNLLSHHDTPALGLVVTDLSAQREITDTRALVEMQNETIRRKNEDLERQELVRQKIEESENRFRMIADTAPVLIWMTDTDKRCTFFNKSWLSFTGRTAEQEASYGWTENVYPDDLGNVLEVYTTSFDAHREFCVEYRLLHHSGQYRWVSDTGVPRHDSDGTFLGFIGSCADITEHKTHTDELTSRVAERTHELQEANVNLKRSNTELERFAYVASHDLQEPLRKITTVSGRLAKKYGEALTDDGKMMLDIMTRAANRMKMLIESLLAFSRVARQEKDTGFEKTDLNAVMGNIVSDLEIKIKETGADIQCHGLPKIEAIPQQMQQLFQNLVSNALKFSKPGTAPRITIHAQPLPDSQKQELKLDAQLPYVHIAIGDNGIGFEKEYAERIFVIFQRLHGHAEYAGTGIGLAICKQVVENHGGILTADSVPGVGSTFNIILPESQRRAAPQ